MQFAPTKPWFSSFEGWVVVPEPALHRANMRESPYVRFLSDS
jgi:hypothetical protein